MATATTPIRDAALVPVGFTVLAVRQAAGSVSEFEERLTARNERVGKALEQARDRASAVRTQLEELMAPYAERLQSQVDKLVGRLPEPARKSYKDAIAAGRQTVEGFESFARTITQEPAVPAKKPATKPASAKATA